MERLTKKEQLAGNTVSYVTVEDCFDVWSVPKKFMGNAIERLAAIEDILGDEYDLGRLRELVQADKAGKCMVLPCKPGQLVWSVNSDRVSSHVIRRLERNKDGDFACSMLMFPFDDFGKKVFLTKAEAEAALRREQDG